ncbi:MAG: hypothetical protein ACOYOP_06250 [Microthrixaceae bacterium]
MPAPCPTPLPAGDSAAPESGPPAQATAPAPTLVARTQCRAITAALHRGPVVGLDHDPDSGTYRLVVTLR